MRSRMIKLSVVTVCLLSSVAYADLNLPTPKWRSCGERLQQLAGRSINLDTVYSASRVRTDEFLTYLLAIAYVESRFIPNAVSHKNAYGVMQVTRPAILDAAAHCKLNSAPTVQQLFTVSRSVTYGSCYMQRLLTTEYVAENWTRLLIAYNRGLRGLSEYDKGVQLPTETANYVLQVQRLVGMCSTDSREGISE